jgi:hypothetical protein
MNEQFFYGYHIIPIVKNLDLEPLVKINGRILKGDQITIIWDESEMVFKVRVTP